MTKHKHRSHSHHHGKGKGDDDPSLLHKLEQIEVPEPAKPALRLVLFDIIVQSAAALLKNTAEKRARTEIREAIGRKAAKKFERRNKFVGRSALAMASRSVPLALVVGGGAAAVLWYGHAKKQRDARREARANGENGANEKAAKTASADSASQAA